MKKGKTLSILSILLLLVILAIAIPVIPAQAAVTLIISPQVGSPGTRVTVMGTPTIGFTTGLGPDQTVSLYLVSPTLGSYEVEQFSRDHSNDFFQGYFLLPSLDIIPAGTYNVELRPCPPGIPSPPCTLTPLSLQSAISFTITSTTTTTTTTTGAASITLTPSQGTPGTIVTVNGTKFGIMVTVHLYLDNTELGVKTSDLIGSFIYTVPINKSESRTYTIKAEDDSSPPISASADFQLVKELKAYIGKNNGAVGANQEVAGTGFKPNTAITIKYDDTEITSAKTTTDGQGDFKTSFKIPVSIGGDHKITITDGTTPKTFTFTMEKTPPPAPGIVSPAVDAVMDGPVYFDWSDVTDDSTGGSNPVTYTLQIATDPSFIPESIVIEKKDLKDSRATLSNAETDKLVPVATAAQPTPQAKKYYWQVVAIDAASNKADASTSKPSTFIMPAPKATAPAPSSTTPTTPTTPTSPTTPKPQGAGMNLPGNLPGWAIYALAALIALLFLFIGILIGRRSAYY